jgi:hypothetical protein
MTTSYLRYLPKPLLEDLVQNRWIPIVGAGLSRNAEVPRGTSVPLWKELGEAFGQENGDYSADGPIDAISAYAHRFGRAKLMEKLTELLLVDSAKPGKVHEAFCRIGFDIVCTTNLDLLLERQYDGISRYCRPITDDDQLAIGLRQSPDQSEPRVNLLKLHGDVHHPKSTVVTEEDYEGFLHRHPLKSTYLANLLICRTAVLIGYSLDDPDLRQIWRVISDRLVELRRPAYALMVGPSPTLYSRFERRQVQVVELPGKPKDYPEVLAALFTELREHWREKLSLESVSSENESIGELALPSDATSRICFFAVPRDLQSFYREKVYPMAKIWGFVPLTDSDVVARGEPIWAKVDALISRADLIVADVVSPNALSELLRGIRNFQEKRVLIIGPQDSQEVAVKTFSSEVHPQKLPIMLTYIVRPANPIREAEAFLPHVNDWFQAVAGATRERLEEEPGRLLTKKEYRAAVISAMSLLEARLRSHLQPATGSSAKSSGLLPLIDQAIEQQLIHPRHRESLRRWVRERNAAVHMRGPVSAKFARDMVNGIRRILQELPNAP